MKGLGRRLIALLVAGALFAAMAVPALAAHDNSGTASQGKVNGAAGAAEVAVDDTELLDTANAGSDNGLDPE